jgi:hypothetical protein
MNRSDDLTRQGAESRRPELKAGKCQSDPENDAAEALLGVAVWVAHENLERD